jgi:hypothetical protein
MSAVQVGRITADASTVAHVGGPLHPCCPSSWSQHRQLFLHASFGPIAQLGWLLGHTMLAFDAVWNCSLILHTLARTHMTTQYRMRSSTPPNPDVKPDVD